jgi:hypothetical protein
MECHSVALASVGAVQTGEERFFVWVGPSAAELRAGLGGLGWLDVVGPCSRRPG